MSVFAKEGTSVPCYLNDFSNNPFIIGGDIPFPIFSIPSLLHDKKRGLQKDTKAYFDYYFGYSYYFSFYPNCFFDCAKVIFEHPK